MRIDDTNHKTLLKYINNYVCVLAAGAPLVVVHCQLVLGVSKVTCHPALPRVIPADLTRVKLASLYASLCYVAVQLRSNNFSFQMQSLYSLINQ